MGNIGEQNISSEARKIKDIYRGLEYSTDDGTTATIYYHFSDPAGVGFDAVRDALLVRVRGSVGDAGVSAGYQLVKNNGKDCIEVTLKENAHRKFRFLQELDDSLAEERNSRSTGR
jgi:hypothetical protein